jgi:hypothetical protein
MRGGVPEIMEFGVVKNAEGHHGVAGMVNDQPQPTKWVQSAETDRPNRETA